MLFSDWLLHNSLLMQHTQQQLATQQTSPGRMGNTSAAVWNVISAQKSVFSGRKQRKLPAGFSPGLKALGVTTHGEQTLLMNVRKREKQTSFSLTVKLHIGNVKHFWVTPLFLNMPHISMSNVKGGDLLFPNTNSESTHNHTHTQMWTNKYNIFHEIQSEATFTNVM